MDKTRITWSDMKENLSTMNLETADVLIDLRGDFCTTTDEDIRELMIILQNAAEIVIDGCENLTKGMHIRDSVDLMGELYAEAGFMLEDGFHALGVADIREGQAPTHIQGILEKKVAALQMAVEDFEDAANKIIDKGM